jgi:hypothetical protein
MSSILALIVILLGCMLIFLSLFLFSRELKSDREQKFIRDYQAEQTELFSRLQQENRSKLQMVPDFIGLRLEYLVRSLAYKTTWLLSLTVLGLFLLAVGLIFYR